MKKRHNLPSTSIGRRRLLKLAGLLEKDAKNKKGIEFDLSTWGWAGDRSNPVACGTVACAMGLAVASGAFIRAGLAPMSRSGSLLPRVGRSRGTAAAARLFQIKEHEAGWLFLPQEYPAEQATMYAEGERNVAKRIRDFVAGRARP